MAVREDSLRADRRREALKALGIVAGGASLLLAGLLSGAAAAERPMYYLETFGPKGDVTATLTWGLIAQSLIVVGLVSIMVVIGVIWRRRFDTGDVHRLLPVTRSPGGVTWIYIGLALTTVSLAAFTFWTIDVMAEIDEPSQEPRFTIEIVGQQWWWGARYSVEGAPYRTFDTANELHIPVGEPVRIRLRSQDVIHSFWVPALAGKTDVIPGQVNETWIQADAVGVYRGQCAEYCGAQHAHMAMRVFADPPEVFEAWWNEQLEPAEPVPAATLADAGQRQFQLRCGGCHTVRGTLAGGQVGPDLTHLMSRTTIAAGMLPNTIGHLSGWVANPQTIKPESKMPNLELSGPQLTAIRHYLLTLD
jgi:cytochrome c oxidase subunit 2